ncbi:MAG: pantetheine-phosphate adenylyltransferase [Clostridia bacterium]|nr:pantetheine-phosphate adenylyltransferase [Clostridia bacterium]MBR2878661.1 pantetheine-phosphate adenylyltransferase [Clostridia bacterium]MBR2973146.1 pantetheine-phosphate adenylyltransferase [Clostridia bacterium]MBR3575870.1 pantetheine-phosphate adenylyltransferase [Clostridia bacterium]
MKVAIYPGSFDPVTNGHLDIIKRAAAIFDEVVVAIFVNSAKKSTFTVEERISMLKTVTKDIPNVKVISSDKLLVNYMQENNIKIIVKGLRMISDFEFEFQMALTNREQSPDIETLFMMTASEYSHVSSSIVRELAAYGGNLEKMVPAGVIDTVLKKFNN